MSDNLKAAILSLSYWKWFKCYVRENIWQIAMVVLVASFAIFIGAVVVSETTKEAKCLSSVCRNPSLVPQYWSGMCLCAEGVVK
jgi:hypothetical protein